MSCKQQWRVTAGRAGRDGGGGEGRSLRRWWAGSLSARLESAFLENETTLRPHPPLSNPRPGLSDKTKTDKLDVCRERGGDREEGVGGAGSWLWPPVPSTRLTDGGRVLGAGGRPLLVKVVVQVPSCRREQSRGQTDGQQLQGHRESRVE